MRRVARSLPVLGLLTIAGVASARLAVPSSALAPPGAPSSLAAIVSASTVTLLWTAPLSGDAATSYVIEAGSSAGARDLASFPTGTAATSYIATNVPAGTYFVRVRATNAAGASEPSNEVVVSVTTVEHSAPGAPTRLAASVNRSTVTLSWNVASSGGLPTSYIVEAGSTSGASNLANFDTGNALTILSTNDVANGTYFVRVRARNAAGTSGPSNEVVAAVVDSTPSGLVLRASFAGIQRSFGGMPPDLTIAAGPASLVISSNDSITVLSKTGARIATQGLNNVFAPVKTQREALTDPTILFDPDSRRFFLVASGAYRDDPNCALGSCVAHLFLAVSLNESPQTMTTADWSFYALDATLEGGTRTRDFPDASRIAVDDHVVAIVSTQSLFGSEGNPHLILRILDKSRVLSGDASAWTDVALVDPSGTLLRQVQPVINLDRTPTGTLFLVNPLGCDFWIISVDNELVAPKLVFRNTSQPATTGSCSQPPDPPQPNGAPPLAVSIGPTLQTGPVYRNGSIWIVEHIRKNFGSGDVSAVRWAQIDVSQWPNAVTFRQDSTFGADRVHGFFPAIMADPSNNVALVFGVSSTTEFPSAYYTGRLGTDPLNTLRAAALLKAGEGIQNTPTGDFGGRQRWGDYFGAAFDPADGSAWLLGEYVRTADTWGTWVANIGWRAGPAPPAGPPPGFLRRAPTASSSRAR
ncbi:MAG: fibronectin type III domain-containing protein [Acidobacteria bacterium]|nr:fibronectin type III domain-containing protein [Acidobacteriota bacterium]